MPDLQNFNVACIVCGTYSLSTLESLLPSAQQCDMRESPQYKLRGWGDGSPKLYRFAEAAREEQARRTKRPACLVSLTVRARDRGTAVQIGRREISELLDQYVAGHRVADLRLTSTSLGGRVGSKKVASFQAVGASVAIAYPLTKAWPAQLREALRMSHLAATTDAPMSRVSLAWTAMEACGVKVGNQGNVVALAEAMALQSLRQQIVESYHNMRQAAAALLAVAAEDAAVAASCERQAVSAAQRVRLDSPHRTRLEDRAKAAAGAAQVADQRLESLRRDFKELLAELHAYVATDARDHLIDVNQWLDILQPSRAQDCADLRRARAALTTLGGRVRGIAAAELAQWCDRLASPSRCADLLDEWTDRYHRNLDWLYAVRNMSVHSGAFMVPGDLATAHSAVALADFLLEFLGNWYEVARRTGRADREAMSTRQVIECLADRKRKIALAMRTQPDSFPLNLSYLTSPTSDGWDRAR
ncbi:hypothetical protein AB0893_26815 [Micromonospora aurantiaca]|uniref:hypothetical protein n=1 Tax=Micromonospora aurantiaca (nom. illeg.) TaxID=47850 RepID=UPI0034565A34